MLPQSLVLSIFIIEEIYNWSLDLFRYKTNREKHTKIIYVEEIFTVQKDHNKCIVAQKEAH